MKKIGITYRNQGAAETAAGVMLPARNLFFTDGGKPLNASFRTAKRIPIF